MGVEFSSRPSERNAKADPSKGRQSSTESSAARSLRESAGKVPPSARVARSAASAHLNPDAPDLRGFSTDESLAELRELTASAGATVIGEFLQRRPKPDPATLIGSGKLEELKGAVASSLARSGHLRSRADAHRSSVTWSARSTCG